MTKPDLPLRFRVIGVLKTAALSLLFTAVVVLMMLYLVGAFHAKVSAAPSAAPAPPATTQIKTEPVRKLKRPVRELAVGTIRPIREAQVASKLTARVVEMNVKAGQVVKKGDVLARLDDADLKARLDQARAVEAAAKAHVDQAKIEYDKVQKLAQENAAAPIEVDRATAALRSAEADRERAAQAVAEARTVLEYAVIAAPMDGIVVDKLMDVGEMAAPGRVLVGMYGPTMQLVASVRESLAQRLQEYGDKPIDVRIDALKATCPGQISEIVPEAQSASRSFLVKVTGPCKPGVYPGMFGRLIIPLDDEEVLAIPAAAVQRVGQLDMVEVVAPSRAGETPVTQRRAVQLGRSLDAGLVEVLSGLREGEQVAVR